MTRIELKESFLDIDPKVDVKARGFELLCVDVENVLTDFGNESVLPGVAEHVEEIKGVNKDLKIVLITNKIGDAFLDGVLSQLPSGIDYVNPMTATGLKKKPNVSMFRYALSAFGEYNSAKAAHVDDQSKAWIGANQAGFDTFFWTKPSGENQHKGVKALRPIEFGLIRPFITIATDIQEIRAGDW